MKVVEVELKFPAWANCQPASVSHSLFYLWPSDSQHFSGVTWARRPFVRPCLSPAACAPLTVRLECNSVAADVTLEMSCLVTGSGDSCRAYKLMIWQTRPSYGQMRGVLVCNHKPRPWFKEKDGASEARLTHRGVRTAGSDAWTHSASGRIKTLLRRNATLNCLQPIMKYDLPPRHLLPTVTLNTCVC